MKVPLLLLSSLLALTACGHEDGGEHDNNLPSCVEDDRDEEYVAGIRKTGTAGYSVAIMDSNPAPPSKDNNTWTLEIRDDSDTAVEGLIIESAPFMPDHGHGTPIVAELSDLGGGMYQLEPINLFMPGYWEVSLTVVDPGATESPDDDSDLDTVMFKFCVEG